jgi:membrane protein implicated in regulation of membrane protease activity
MSTVYFITLLLALIYIALAAAFVILLIGKLGIRDNIIAKAPKLISQLFDCDFCLSFWVSLILAVILAIFFREMNILVIPIISTPITRILI